MLCRYVLCPNAEYRYTDYHYAEFRHAGCRNVLYLHTVFLCAECVNEVYQMLYVFMLSFIIPSAGNPNWKGRNSTVDLLV
jgi:hypothetical protein